MTCGHGDPRRITYPGGYAVLTTSGTWTGYFEDRPGEVFSLTHCPSCLVELHRRRPGDRDAPNIPGEAHSMHRRRD